MAASINLEEHELIASLPRDFLEALGALDLEEKVDRRIPVVALAFEAWIEKVPKKTTIVEQGAIDSDFYILLDGAVGARRISTDPEHEWGVDFGWKIKVDWFGEASILGKQPEVLQYTAKKDCTLLVVERETFKAYCAASSPELAGFREYIETNFTANFSKIRTAVALADELMAQTVLRGLPGSFFVDSLLQQVVQSEEASDKRAAKKVERFSVHGEDYERAYLERRTKGEVIVQQGTYASDVYLILAGDVDILRRDDDGKITNLAQLGQSTAVNWFGEMTALSNRPQFADCKAMSDCNLLVLSAPTFKKFFTKPGFRGPIIENYRKMGLPIQLKLAPLFEGLDDVALGKIAKLARFSPYDKGTVIASADGREEKFYVVQSGVVKWLLPQEDGSEKFHAALCANSSFGEQLLASNAASIGRYVADTDVFLIELTRTDLEKVDDATVERMRENAEFLKTREAGKALKTAPGKYLVKANRVLVIDLERCTRCNVCVESCVAVHEDRVPRLSKRGMRDFEGRGKNYLLTSACYHCETPDCMASCNFGAIRRTLTGEIDFVYDACVGCQKCEQACPYDVIRMADIKDSSGDASPAREQTDDAAPPERSPSIFSLLTGLLSGGKPKDPPITPPETVSKQKAIKCDLCAGLPFEACVYNCPYAAIERYSPEVIDREGLRG